MRNIKVRSRDKECMSKVIAVFSFITVFLIQIALNRLVPCMRSLPDEMGAMALAAKAAGYNWNYVLTHPSKYYGSGTFILLYPFFVFVKNPLILYQFLLGTGAFLHAVPAYISCRIVQKYYRFMDSSWEVYLLGIACSFFTPTRSVNIDNEPMLILLCWIIFYLLIVLQNEKNFKSKTYSALLAAILAFSCLSHTRAIIYSVAIFCVFFIYRIFKKETIVNLKIFLFVYSLCFVIVNVANNFLKEILFTSNSSTVVVNTPGEIVSSAATNIQSVFSKVGLQSIVDLLFSNIWIIFVFGFGIIPLCFVFLLNDTIKNIKQLYRGERIVAEKDSYFSTLFCFLGILFSLAGVCIIWLPNAIGVHTEEMNLSRGHFYLRYYGNYFGPLFLLFIIRLRRQLSGNEKSKLIEKAAVIITVMMIILVYILESFLRTASVKYKHSLDWFYYFAPFSGNMDFWPETLQNIPYFLCSTLICINIFVLILYLTFHKKHKFVLMLLSAALIWQYSFGVIHFDSPYANSDNYYQSVNAFYKLCSEENAILDQANELFYFNETYGPAYIVQFMLPEVEVISDITLLDSDCENVILSNVELSAEQLKRSKYFFVQLDKNEYLYINNEEIIKVLQDKGYAIVSVNL